MKIKGYWVITAVRPTIDREDISFTTQNIVKGKSPAKAIQRFYEKDNYWALKHNDIVTKIEQLNPEVKLNENNTRRK